MVCALGTGSHASRSQWRETTVVSPRVSSATPRNCPGAHAVVTQALECGCSPQTTYTAEGTPTALRAVPVQALACPAILA
jgi:hypothetical protein